MVRNTDICSEENTLSLTVFLWLDNRLAVVHTNHMEVTHSSNLANLTVQL